MTQASPDHSTGSTSPDLSEPLVPVTPHPHAMTADALIEALGSQRHGLRQQEITERLKFMAPMLCPARSRLAWSLYSFANFAAR